MNASKIDSCLPKHRRFATYGDCALRCGPVAQQRQKGVRDHASEDSCIRLAPKGSTSLVSTKLLTTTALSRIVVADEDLQRGADRAKSLCCASCPGRPRALHCGLRGKRLPARHNGGRRPPFVGASSCQADGSGVDRPRSTRISTPLWAFTEIP